MSQGCPGVRALKDLVGGGHIQRDHPRDSSVDTNGVHNGEEAVGPAPSPQLLALHS